MMEQSFMGNSADLSDGERIPSYDMNVSQNESMDILRSSDPRGMLETPGSAYNVGSPNEFEIGSPNVLRNSKLSSAYTEAEQKEGHIIFSILRPEILKAFSIKTTYKADSFLDKATFIARKLASIWFGKDISLEHFNMFVDLLKEKAYLLSFPILLEGFRKLGYFELDPKGYKPFCELILACLTEVSNFNIVCG